MLDKQTIYDLIESQGGESGMSEFQARYFVCNSQITPYRKVRQAMLELETRIAGRKQMERNIKRAEIQKQMHLRDQSMEPDTLAQQLIQCDIDQLDYDLSVYEKKMTGILKEIDIFINIIRETVQDSETLIDYHKWDMEKEREYWIARMGKQAAMDLVTMGRLGQGNLDSIVMMPIEEQTEALKLAAKYSGMIDQGMGILTKQALQELAQVPAQLQFVDELVDTKLQLQNKAQGEDI